MTVAGRPAAELHPIAGRRWVGGPALDAIWDGPAPTGLEHDFGLAATVTDPFAG